MTRASFVICLLLSCIANTFSGHAHRGPKVVHKIRVIGTELPPQTTGERIPYPSNYSLGPGDSIGFTTYDYGTNGSVMHNLLDVGSSFTLTRMGATDTSWSDLGSYFSCYAGGWSELTRMDMLGGWASGDVFDAAGGVEAVSTLFRGEMSVSVDAAGCANVWTEIGLGTGLWPRVATSDAFDLYLVYCDSSPPTTLLYSHSSDAGGTFDITGQELFNHQGYRPEADGYDIAAHGTRVAVVSAGPGGDVVLVESTDNGSTWVQSVILDVAGEGELPEGEEQWQPDGACAIVYDNSNRLHVVWSNFLAVGDSDSNPVLYYSVDAGLMYWTSESRIVQLPPAVTDTTMDPPVGRNGNYSSQPDIGIGLGGVPRIVFTQLIPERDAFGNNYGHIYGDCNLGGYWFTDITPGAGFDASFPSLSDEMEYWNYDPPFVYNCDPWAGNAVSGNHPVIQVAVMGVVDRWPCPIIDVEEPDGVPFKAHLEQNYPNPFNPITEIRFQMSDVRSVTLAIYDILGRHVATLVNEKLSPGTYTRQWDAADQPSGVYFYRIKAGSYVETKKLVLLR